MMQVMRNSTVTINSAEETTIFGAELGNALERGTVVALFGDLGAGKTTLIKGLAAAAAGIDPRSICSPTFTYLNIYSGNIEIYHFDLYRLRNEEDFLSLGFDEYLKTDGICCIEWPEKIPTLLPENTLLIEIAYSGENKRIITLK
jgi:tRNA threonylcarbamoyladenosine biosynthesis protein TsaE